MSEASRARASNKPWMWAAWAVVSAACLAAVWLTFVQFNASPWILGHGLLGSYLRFYVAPALSVAALVLPILALVTLLFRRFHLSVLAGAAIVAALLLAYVGLEAWWAAQAPGPNDWLSSTD